MPIHSRNSSQYERLVVTDNMDLDDDNDDHHSLHLRQPSMDTTESSAGSAAELAGIYLGILNLYTTVPQFIATLISTVVFTILEPGKSPELAHDAHPDEHHGTDGPNGISVCLFIGAISALGAAYATQKMKGQIYAG